jgi:diketogulonate reductase-like aldo/keto reductase
MPVTEPIVVHANGANIPALGLGTFRSEGEVCVKAVSEAIRIGYRHIDTARMYGNEAEVGEGIRASGVPRDQLFVTTKVWFEDIADGDLQRSAEQSLRRLGLDRVDLLLIHWPNRAVPLDSSIGALCDAKRRGLTNHIGVSNHPVALLDRAVALATEPLVANQCEYHPYLDQSKVLAACRRHGMALTSYTPLGKGHVADDPVVKRIASLHGRAASQIVLRWHVQQPGVAAIPKSSNPGRIAENFGIWDFALSQDEMAAISALARPGGRVVNPGFAPYWD